LGNHSLSLVTSSKSLEEI